MKHFLTTFTISIYCSLAIAQMPAYYQSIDFSQAPATVEANLKTLITNTHNTLTYSQTYVKLKSVDEDAANTSNVILMYSGTSESKNNQIGGDNQAQTFPSVWNREHVYPQSLISTTAAGDLHHLRACDGTINGDRSNKAFAAGSGTYASLSTTTWYPGDDWKGDVARMIMYIHVRYDEPWNDVGSLSLFLQWNVEDPVSTFEKQRNNRIQTEQGNRNPFIDQPYLATYLWGGTPAEDTWGWPNTVEESALNHIHIYPNPSTANSTLRLADINTKVEAIYLTDISGKTVQSWTSNLSNAPAINLELNDVAKGIYILKIEGEHSVVAKRVVME